MPYAEDVEGYGPKALRRSQKKSCPGSMGSRPPYVEGRDG